MKFLADNMLGRLATWLRLLGYDTCYLPEADDAELARVARAEDRVLLTRDVELTRRRGIRPLLIESDKVEEQLRQVLHQLDLTVQHAFSLCARCNVPLDQVDKEAVRSRVPPYVFASQAQFLTCPKCKRVYWRGTHWAHMLARIKSMELPSVR
jgi:uncharacterized protein with PIN domain